MVVLTDVVVLRIEASLDYTGSSIISGDFKAIY